MIKRENLILNFLKDELNDVSNSLNRELSNNNNIKFNARNELNQIKWYVNTF